jgi:hypothetical protein
MSWVWLPQFILALGKIQVEDQPGPAISCTVASSLRYEVVPCRRRLASTDVSSRHDSLLIRQFIEP